MNFKDRNYYIAKVKNILGLAVSAIIVDAIILFMLIV